jgi:hypothetical protein
LLGRRRGNDRRVPPRFEIVGDLWGTLDITRPVRVVNISMQGALIEIDRRWDIGSVHTVTIASGGDPCRGRMCVRHIREAGEREGSFLAGVEFLSVSPGMAGEIARWLAANGGSVAES